ncbi:methyltransferase domain-containing protein [Hahella sp. HN01]|uniref:methyltransferase domain-containing protein n=1 Tax=unclassified Hahella TaxID=2624107 RepID=UPI001C1EF78A|nr:methyltransferase domain-containing protein [Hahella sp. HN01]MBU6949947.1 class I SAM-dependent methyltransferase [Hahella sp. HN01]
MLISPETEAYLTGEKFTNSGRFKIISERQLLDRNQHILNICKERSVLHVGCCDHIPLIEKKIKRGSHLHSLLNTHTKKCIGLDIDEKSISYLKEIGISNIFTPETLPQDKYDVCLAADVIEHVGNVQSFLNEINRHDFKTLVITTPNALRIKNFTSLKYEEINSDHRYWFSPYTLCKTITEAGYIIKNVIYGHRPKKLNFIYNAFFSYFPKYRDDLIIVSEKK